MSLGTVMLILVVIGQQIKEKRRGGGGGRMWPAYIITVCDQDTGNFMFSLSSK